MAVSKPNLSANVADFSENSALFSCGKIYVADGGYLPSEADTAFANTTSQLSEMAKYEEISDLGEKPFKLDSKVTKLKTLNYVIEGKRTNTVEITLVGLTKERKQWLEEELGSKIRTFLLENTKGNSVMIFNAKRWICEWTYEADSLFNAVISTEYSGPSDSGFRIYTNIPDA